MLIIKNSFNCNCNTCCWCFPSRSSKKLSKSSTTLHSILNNLIKLFKAKQILNWISKITSIFIYRNHCSITMTTYNISIDIININIIDIVSKQIYSCSFKMLLKSLLDKIFKTICIKKTTHTYNSIIYIIIIIIGSTKLIINILLDTHTHSVHRI